MGDTNKIFKHLRDFEVAPPQGLFGRLWRKIRKLKTGGPAVSSVSFISEKESLIGAEKIKEENIFSELQSYTDKDTAPPPFDFKKIAAEVLTEKISAKKTSKNSPAVIRFLKITAAAAIIGIAVFIYYNNSTKEDTTLPKDSASINEKNDSAIRIVQNNNIAKPINDSKENLAVANNLSEKKWANENTYITKHLKVADLYNDFMYTLTNFRNEQVKTFLSDIKKDKKVALNNYSYLNISDRMATFLKKMYAVNKGKKPTRKAKKLKSKLVKWKKKDEANFDTNMRKNPMDIIDLSEFILKN